LAVLPLPAARRSSTRPRYLGRAIAHALIGCRSLTIIDAVQIEDLRCALVALDPAVHAPAPERRLASEPVDLSPPRDARLDAVPLGVVGYRTLEVSDEVWPFGARAEFTYLALEDVAPA
jgi:hypothetical protein